MKSGKFCSAVAAGVMLCVLATGCAQPSGSPSSRDESSVPASAPVDRWESGVEKDGQTVRYANAGIATASRDAALLIGCTEDDKSVVLLVDPNKELGIEASMRSVTIILDGHTRLFQDWHSSPAAYGTGESDPAFAALLSFLKKHKEVEFVLGEPGKEIDRRRFKLEGAGTAIDDVMRNCDQ